MDPIQQAQKDIENDPRLGSGAYLLASIRAAGIKIAMLQGAKSNVTITEPVLPPTPAPPKDIVPPGFSGGSGEVPPAPVVPPTPPPPLAV